MGSSHRLRIKCPQSIRKFVCCQVAHSFVIKGRKSIFNFGNLSLNGVYEFAFFIDALLKDRSISGIDYPSAVVLIVLPLADVFSTIWPCVGALAIP